MPRTDFKHVTSMFGRWHRLLFTIQERRIRHRQARSDYGHIKADFTFTCHVLPVSSRPPHNQTSRAVPYRSAFHCMVELVTSSIIETTAAGSTGIIANSSNSSAGQETSHLLYNTRFTFVFTRRHQWNLNRAPWITILSLKINYNIIRPLMSFPRAFYFHLGFPL
jgi:hypothetical protein